MGNGPDMSNVPRLIANLDAIAMLRETSRSMEPDPVQAAAIAEAAGAAGVAVHLREDRRYIQDRDARLLKETVKSSFHLSIAPTEGLLTIAEALAPDHVTLVPVSDAAGETAGEDLGAREDDLRGAIERLGRTGARVGLVVEPDLELIKQAAGLGAQAVSLHLGAYAQAGEPSRADQELEALRNAADYARRLGLRVRAAGGAHVRNCEPLFAIESIQEHEIGHGLVARAVLIGLGEAVRELIGLMRAARSLVPQYRA